MPHARAPQQGLSSRESLVAQEMLTLLQMLKWAHLKFSSASTCCKSLFLSCAKDSQRENSWSVMISKLSLSGSHLVGFMAGWSTSVHISQGVYSAKVCESLRKVQIGASPSSPSRAGFLWQTLPLPPRGWAAPATAFILLLSRTLQDRHPTHLQVGLAFLEHQLGQEYL